MIVFLPFQYSTLFRSALDTAQTVLDVGCGKGVFWGIINHDRYYRGTGVDLFAHYLKQAKQTGLYEKVMRQDIRRLKFPKRSFDAVICSQVIEHLSKREGFTLMKHMETIALDCIIIGTPNGIFHQDPYDGNELQKHHSTWYPEDFIRRGYAVYGQGWKIVYGPDGLLHTALGKFIFTRIFLYVLAYLVSPLVHVSPHFGMYLVAVKRKQA